MLVPSITTRIVYISNIYGYIGNKLMVESLVTPNST